jgi:aspartate aminotransferase
MPAIRPHQTDVISSGGIPEVRDRLLGMQAKGLKVMRLESGDPSFELPPYIRDSIVHAIHHHKTHYSEGGGIPELRTALAEKVVRENKLPISGPAQVLVGNGATNALFVAISAIVSPGDEIIVPDPNWQNTQDMINLNSATPVRCAVGPATGYKVTPAGIEALITPKTRAILVNTPHNPTGAVYTREDLQALVDLAVKHDLFIISDEAYEHVVYDGRPHISMGSLPGAEDRTLSVFSMSKSYAMAGLRVGYVATTNKTLLARMGKILRASINHVSTATQYGAIEAVKHSAEVSKMMCAEYEARRDILLAGLAETKVMHAFKPEGAFFLWAKIDPSWTGYEGKTDGFAMTNYLIDKIGCGSAPGESFGPAGANSIRFAYSCHREHVERAVEGMRTLFR